PGEDQDRRARQNLRDGHAEHEDRRKQADGEPDRHAADRTDLRPEMLADRFPFIGAEGDMARSVREPIEDAAPRQERRAMLKAGLRKRARKAHADHVGRWASWKRLSLSD